MNIKAYRDYITDTGERVRVVGWEIIDGERWARVNMLDQRRSHLTGKVPLMMVHASRLARVAA